MGDEEKISPGDESYIVSHFVQFIFSSSWVGMRKELAQVMSQIVSHFVQLIFSSSWVGDEKEISPGDES